MDIGILIVIAMCVTLYAIVLIDQHIKNKRGNNNNPLRPIPYTETQTREMPAVYINNKDIY